MAQNYDPYHLKSPTIYLVKNVVFLVIVALVGLILAKQIAAFFIANPFINSLIVIVALTGIFLSFRQILRLFPEIRWVNTFRVAEPGIDCQVRRQLHVVLNKESEDGLPERERDLLHGHPTGFD